jgi:branched-chain amino acid transport system ATP-binding protein
MANTHRHILKGRSISKNFGGLQALLNVDFEVENGMIFAIIGPNGAGKTTLFNLISGFDRDYSGEFIFKDVSLGQFPPHDITLRGIARTFQNVRLFKNLSVLENVAVGCHGWAAPIYSRAIFGFKSNRQEERTIKAHALEMLDFVGLADKRNTEVESLSLGEQKLLEIARALAAKPKLLLLDEPGAGLNDREMDNLEEIIFKNKENGITQIIVEHNMKFIMSISDEIMVLNFGNKIAYGPPELIVSDESVIEVYLGKEEDLVRTE